VAGFYTGETDGQAKICMKMTGRDFWQRMFFTKSDPGRGFKGVDCFHCHGGAHFTNHQFLNNGLDGDPREVAPPVRCTGETATRRHRDPAS
jgi:hypothetical protein